MDIRLINTPMTSYFDSYLHTIIENIVPLFKKKNDDGSYTLTDEKGVPQLGGKSFDIDMVERIIKANKDRIFAAEEPTEETPETPEVEELPIKGEYWFDESGNAQYADGDVGDMNHEAYVIQQCGAEVASFFNLDEFHENNIISEIGDEIGDEWGDIENDPANAIIKYLVTFCKMSETKASDLVLTAYGSTVDAREYAIKNWNWIRVHGTNIEVHKLNSITLRNVARGINDALEQEGHMYDDDADERAGITSYNISTYTGKRYSITLNDMEKGDVSGLEEEQTVSKSAATQQVRQMDIDSMPKYYQHKGVIGDSFDSYYNTVIEQLELYTR